MNIKDIEKEAPGHNSFISTAFEAGHGHIFKWWNEITVLEKRQLLDQIASIDFHHVNDLYRSNIELQPHAEQVNLFPPRILPIPQTAQERERAHDAKMLGEESIRRGEVAVLTVAGGQGTRLGIDRPKGVFPITPISEKSLFQLFAEKIRAMQKRYHTTLPWYIMTSETNNADTQEFFRWHNFFGLDSSQITFFSQGMLPAVDFNGKILMDSKYRIVMSPNGHGGVILALKERGIAAHMKKHGIKNIFYHQVDNVLIKIADPVFVGYHIRDKAEMSLKVVKKRYPEEKVGIIALLDGHLHLVEYSELSKENMYKKNGDGTLKYNAGNIAIHMISIAFLEKIFQKTEPLPFHVARKKVPCINEDGILTNPEESNAIKFESFIFDTLRFVTRGVIMEVDRKEEFSPLKNKEGENSPMTARQDMTNLFGRWLHDIGVSIPTDLQGNVNGFIEISPCFALDEEELKLKVDKSLEFNGRLILEE